MILESFLKNLPMIRKKLMDVFRKKKKEDTNNTSNQGKKLSSDSEAEKKNINVDEASRHSRDGRSHSPKGGKP
jgi:hypothetical protein